MQNDLIDRQIARHRKRGLLELDILLMRFFVEFYEKLSLDDKMHLLHLLESSDIDLLNWVMQLKPVSPEYKPLVEMLTSCAKPNGN